MNYTFEFIEKDTDRYKDIKELIKAKGENTCRKYMDRMIISKGLDGSEFAIVSLNKSLKSSVPSNDFNFSNISFIFNLYNIS